MMAQQTRPRQISPLSMESTDSSFYARFNHSTSMDSPYAAATPPGNPGRNHMQPSPPRSAHQSSSTEHSMSLRNSALSPSSHTGHFSSSSSVALSSNGLNSPIMTTEPGGRTFSPKQEDILQEHYNVLRVFLAPEIARDFGARTARAKDKLLRLSPTQYLELSTDVYDEFRRREDDRRRRGQGVPRYLPPRSDFHPKRNQARQKLSHLSPDRFKQLATDAFFELERRIPRLAGTDIDRRASPAGSMGLHPGPMRSGTPSGLRGPPSPLSPGMYRGHAPAGAYPPSVSSRAASKDFGRPLPQAFQSNNIVPNKGTMIEEDESSFGSRSPLHVNTHLSSASASMRGSPMSALPSGAFPSQLSEMQDKVLALEEQLRAQTIEVEKLMASKTEQEAAMDQERETWHSLRQDLDQRLAEEQRVRQASEQERAKMHERHMESQAELRDQLDTTVSTLQAQIDELTTQNDMPRSQTTNVDASTATNEWRERCAELQAQIDELTTQNDMLQIQTTKIDTSSATNETNEWRERCAELQDRLLEQERVTEEVRRDASQFLQDMRVLSEQSDAGIEREEQLQKRVSELEREVVSWKDKYAKTKTLLRTMKASSVGLALHNMSELHGSMARPDFLSPDGSVKDVEMTNFQMSIDELLQTAREGATESTLEKMKAIIRLVQHMTISEQDKPMSSTTTNGLPSPATSPKPFGGDVDATKMTGLRNRVNKAASNLITTTRTFASAKGLAPVSLVDAAAANLTAAVIEYVKTVGIKPSPVSELQDGAANEDRFELISPRESIREEVTDKGPGVKGHGGWFSRLKGSFDSAYSNENGFPPMHDGDEVNSMDTDDEFS